MIVIGNIEILLVKYFTSAEVTGHFGALNMIGKLLFAVNGSIIAVVLPTACAESHGGNKLNRNMLMAVYGAILLVSAGALFMYWAFPVQVISMLFGGKYLVYSAALWRFALAGSLFSFFMLEANLAYAHHNFVINYIILFVIVLMGTVVYSFHDSMLTLINVINGSFGIGFIMSFVLNVLSPQKKLCDDIKSSELIQP
jgi:O-antigen/teichoic acid export membrane protein